MKILNQLLIRSIGVRLFFKYRKFIYANQKVRNQLTALFLLHFGKGYSCSFKLIGKYILSVHSVTWSEDDLYNRLVIGVYRKRGNELMNSFYIKHIT
jgi:hypothetical protein